MTRFAFLILIIISLMNGSCSGKKNKLDKKNLIPEKDLVSILTDIYITDGLLTVPKITLGASSLDSITTYYHVIESHGYSKEAMDKTMKYYFIENPKRLNKIYDKVLGILSEMESRVDKEVALEQARSMNQWPGKDFYSFPDISGNDSTMFNMIIHRPGLYTLTLTATLFPDDQSVNPRVTIYSCSPDSIETGKRKYIKTVDYLKDGRPHTYKLNIPVPDKTILHLRGWLYDFDNPSFSMEKHVKIENISFTFTSAGV